MKVKIGGIMQNDHLARVSVIGVPGRPDTAAVLLNALGQAGVNVEFIVQCPDHHDDQHIVLCVDRDDLSRTLDLVHQLKAQLSATAVNCDAGVASVGIFGPDFRVRPGIAGTFFAALVDAGIHIQAVSTSISTVMVIIAASSLAEAVTAIHRTFELP